MKLYVGNIANTVTDQELNDLFSSYGSVLSARVIKDKFSGQSRGFGFVELSDSDAQSAMSALNGSDFNGQRIIVSEARPPQERPGGFGGNRGGGSRGGFGGGSDRYNR